MTAAVGLGANVGEKAENIRTALKAMDALPETSVVKVSRFYRTAPVGVTDQDWFVNAAALIETALSPNALLDALLAIEKDLGRVRTIKWGPRRIDLDVLFYGREIIKEEELVVPHPFMAERGFVLTPLTDIAPDWTHPVSGLTPVEMLSRLDDDEQAVESLP